MAVAPKNAKEISVKIKRADPDNSGAEQWSEYKVPVQPTMTVMQVLHHIYENLDPSLAYYCSCRIGKCYGCYTQMNGKVILTCCKEAPHEDIVLEPQPRLPVIRDLMVDRQQRAPLGKNEIDD